MDKYIGKRLDGRYEIKELIGVGGMAYVYKAYDSIDDRVVAIKILRDEFMANEEFTRRFKNESKAIAILSHPNIVKVFDVSFGERLQYIVMEYIDGITLKEYIDQQKDCLLYTSRAEGGGGPGGGGTVPASAARDGDPAGRPIAGHRAGSSARFGIPGVGKIPV